MKNSLEHTSKFKFDITVIDERYFEQDIASLVSNPGCSVKGSDTTNLKGLASTTSASTCMCNEPSWRRSDSSQGSATRTRFNQCAARLSRFPITRLQEHNYIRHLS